MDFIDLKKKLLWFSLAFCAVLLIVAYLHCQCLPWLLILTLYVFFILYLLFSIGSKKILDKLHFNPLSYLLVSFFTKVILVVGFAFFLIGFFRLEQETILLLLVFGYLIAAAFDFILLVKSSKNTRP